MGTQWSVTASDGDLLVHTGVTGRAARTGHRLVLVVTTWQASVTLTDDEQPESLTATMTVDSLKVRSGEGGLTPMTGPEKAIARGNALRSLKSDKYPTISYRSDTFSPIDGGFRADGILTVAGTARPTRLDLSVTPAGDRHRVTFETSVRHSDFGLKPYSMMMGSLKVADEVRITLDATVG